MKPDSRVQATEPESHAHNHALSSISLGKWAARIVIGLLAVIGVAVAIGVFVLWPSQLRVSIPGAPQSPDLYKGVVAEQILGDCDFTRAGSGQVTPDQPHPIANPDGGCLNTSIRITTGPNTGKWTMLAIGTQRTNTSMVPGQTPSPDGASRVDLSRPATPGTGEPDLQPGTKILMVDNSGGQPGVPTTYSFYDFQRGVSLWVWGLVFAAIVIAVAQWRGLRALLGLALSGAVIVLFALPSILDGHSAVWVALVASAVILYLVLYLAHGVSLRTSAALLGTLCALAVCGVLAWLATITTRVTGMSNEDTASLQAYASSLSASGVLLAGFVIGALGVLNDVTITQSSATFELARLSPKASRRRTFLSAMRVGRDHIASTVYTLVFAYVGTALPLLLLFSIAGRPLGQVLTSDAVATELVRGFVGGIGLVLSVPLTTAIATLLAKPKRVAVSAEAAARYTQSHPETDASEIRVRQRRAAGAPSAAAAPAPAAPAPAAPAPAAPAVPAAPAAEPTEPQPAAPEPAPAAPEPASEQPRRGRHSAD